MSMERAGTVRRSEVSAHDIVGAVFEPAERAQHFAVMLGGSFGGVPEAPARRLAEHGVCTLALGYFGAAQLPPGLVAIPIESLQRGIDFFRVNFAGGKAVGLLGFSKGAELALVVAAHMGGAVGPVVAVAPSHVVWFGLKPPGPDLDRASPLSSWTLKGAPLPFLPSLNARPEFNERGLRTDVFFNLDGYEPSQVTAATIPVERSTGPILLLSGDDDHQWPAVPMADRIVRRMNDHGRAQDITSVVYPGAGHVFLVLDFLRPGGPAFDYGGAPDADRAAGADAWRRIPDFLKSSNSE
jgi:hypothetical protein